MAQSVSAIIPVVEARRLILPSIFGVSKPRVPRSPMKPRISPSSLAQMIARSAIGAMVIHVLPPLKTNPPAKGLSAVDRETGAGRAAFMADGCNEGYISVVALA